MKQTYTGGCHCGAVRYEASVDLSQGTIRCNCSICRKSRAWLVATSPADFRLLSGDGDLISYRFAAERIEHLFCRRCGIKSFGRARTPDGEFVALMVSCIDGLDDAELSALQVLYVDGRNDDFQSAPAQTGYL